MPRGEAPDAGQPAPPRRRARPVLVTRNLWPALGWTLMTLFFLLVAFMAWMIRHELFGRTLPHWVQQAALVVVWIGGFVAGAHQFRIPCTWVQRLPGGDLRLTRRWPLHWRQRHIPRAAIRQVAVVPALDRDGEALNRLVLDLADGEQVVVAEGHHAGRQQAAAARLAAALDAAE